MASHDEEIARERRRSFNHEKGIADPSDPPHHHEHRDRGAYIAEITHHISEVLPHHESSSTGHHETAAERRRSFNHEKGIADPSDPPHHHEHRDRGEYVAEIIKSASEHVTHALHHDNTHK